MASFEPRFLAVLLAACLAGCGASKPDESQTIPLTLPGGNTIRVEVMMDATDMARGMMFRDRMLPDHGMLFVHREPGPVSYWMYQVKIPLDMLFLDSSRRIAHIAADVPPCPRSTASSACPTYGSNQNIKYVLELAGGDAARRKLQIGDTLIF
jgi:uncharacterized membrane protein (UPF0127 family)